MTPPEPRGGEGLKPCPFCGGEPEINERRGGTSIRCPNDQCIISTDVPIPFNDVGSREAAIAAWNRRPTAPSASGGEAVAWDSNVLNTIVGTDRDVLTRGPYAPKTGERVRTATQLFAHPARMPTREEVARYLMRRYTRADIPIPWERVSEYGRENWLKEADAILALFHTGETKGDGRG